MRHVAFTLISSLTPGTALKKIMQLFDQEAVRYEATECVLRSTKVPFAVFTLDPRMYSRRNWLGLNPFVFASRIVVTAKEDPGGQTMLDVLVDRSRAIGMYLVGMINVLVVAAALPEWWGRLALILFFAIALFLFFLRFPSRAIREEIRNAMAT